MEVTPPLNHTADDSPSPYVGSHRHPLWAVWIFGDDPMFLPETAGKRRDPIDAAFDELRSVDG